MLSQTNQLKRFRCLNPEFANASTLPIVFEMSRHRCRRAPPSRQRCRPSNQPTTRNRTCRKRPARGSRPITWARNRRASTRPAGRRRRGRWRRHRDMVQNDPEQHGHRRNAPARRHAIIAPSRGGALLRRGSSIPTVVGRHDTNRATIRSDDVRSAAITCRVYLRRQSVRRAGRHDLVRRLAIEHGYDAVWKSRPRLMPKAGPPGPHPFSRCDSASCRPGEHLGLASAATSSIAPGRSLGRHPAACGDSSAIWPRSRSRKNRRAVQCWRSAAVERRPREASTGHPRPRPEMGLGTATVVSDREPGLRPGRAGSGGAPASCSKPSFRRSVPSS